MIEILSKLVAMLAVTTNNIKARHWTLTGEQYRSWHLQLDEIYQDLAEATDNVAELVVQRGGIPPFSLEKFLELSTIEDIKNTGSYEVYLGDTRDELIAIIEYINQYDKVGVWDGAASNDLTGIASKLYHWYMFLEQTLK